MLAVTLTNPNAADPLAAITVGEHPDPEPPAGWTTVRLRAAALNHHDLWSMRGVGVNPAWLPCVLGSDGAGIDADGNEVIIYPLIASSAAGGGDETLDPRRRMISDGIDGTLAEMIAVPPINLIPKPTSLSWEEAACLPTSWLTAYRMPFAGALLQPGATVLVHGAGGGLSTALVLLGKAAGLRVWVTSRSREKAARAIDQLGADAAFGPGERLPDRVDAVMESVGRATWSHSVRALRPGGRLIVAGLTSGSEFDPDLSRVFLNQLSIVGSALGSVYELRRLATLCDTANIRPVIDSIHSLDRAPAAISRMLSDDLFGKVAITL